MSLLMQALKKAESAKQKQSAAAEPEMPAETTALDSNRSSDQIALSPKEPAAATTVSDSGNAPAARSTVALDMMDMELAPVISKHDAPAGSSASVPEQEFSPAPSADQALSSSNNEHTTQESSFSPAAPDAAKPDAQAEYANRPKEKFQAAAQQPPPVQAPPAQHATAAATPAIALPSTAQLKAKAVFASKQPSRNRRAIVMATVGFVTVAALAGSGYYYLQTMSQSSTVFAGAAQPAPQTVAAPQTSAPASASASATDPTTAPAATQAANPATPESATAIAGAVAVPATAVQEPARAIPVNSASGAPAAPKLLAASAVSAASASTPISAPASAASMPAARSTSAATPQQAHASIATDAKAIQVRKTNTDNQINPALSNAYQLLITGDAEAAHQQYQKVLQLEPNNRDALLGMASIALSRKQAPQAGGYYLKLLELDPADPDAIAGLTSLQSGDASQNESRLKKILTQNPQAGAILFVLGNLYAQQARWPDAQQAYFRAYGTAPGNADYAFNLAVSLDKLNQGKLALDFYQRALTLVQTSPGNFNRTAVENRIAKLRAASGS